MKMKILDPRPHGYIDHLGFLLLVLAPALFGLGGAAATLCHSVPSRA
jgi:hypothetical protein